MSKCSVSRDVSAVAVALKQANTPDFKSYQQQVLANAKVMAKGMMDRGYTIVSGKEHRLSPVRIGEVVLSLYIDEIVLYLFIGKMVHFICTDGLPLHWLNCMLCLHWLNGTIPRR